MAIRDKILIGNTFPLTLVRGHRVVIEDVPLSDFVVMAKACYIISFWGHENTRRAAETILGINLKPETPRPAIVLNDAGYPTLNGEVFGECYVLSPDYRTGFRPAIGVEVSPSEIKSWYMIHLLWDS